ncbi:DUF4148 domain-containing protein [Herbaspirillum sp. WKF16]|uniref:DUF4148 domain-containing protein n=1 Tax=Herbaspirillum sp. WKF16 TaxID=3028312 RepID=UPI0023A9FE18|nr:DUF4148 domain-containing protein [Herbaspirillum sp. WKF16]WDZ95818.1 DUF4148 domain-containing protein [Herbaspirillum sp. WKF16]
MKSVITKIIATTILACASVGAIAQTQSAADAERDWDNMHALNQYPIIPFKSTKTRAEVKAELVAAQKAGAIANGDNYPILPATTTHKTRAQVRAELVAAQREGLIANGDNYPIIKQAESHKTRAQVEAEVATAEHAAQVSGDHTY